MDSSLLIMGSQNNIQIVARERGKIVARRESHNIWVDLGREFLTKVMSYATYAPDTFQEVLLPRYMGFGIGGIKQNALGIANVAPCLTHYPGTNVQSDISSRVRRLERPCRISWVIDPPSVPGGVPGAYTYDAGDIWLRQITPTVHPTSYSVQWSCSFTSTDFSRTTFLAVPISEIGLFLHGSNPNVYNNNLIAYDTFDTLTKTALFDSLDVTWTVRL